MSRLLILCLTLTSLIAAEGAKASLPVTVVGESASPCWTPSGWMDDTSFITYDGAWTQNPRSGATCAKCEFRKSDGWGGVVWQAPANDWGDAAGGWNLSEATKIVIWARGELGGEEVTFSFGLISADKPFHDTAKGETKVTLTRDWAQYEIPASGKDLSHIKTGFCWIVGGQTATFYLDDVRWE
jgi:hypothetical protein